MYVELGTTILPTIQNLYDALSDRDPPWFAVVDFLGQGQTARDTPAG
jgi:hypothetical protein